jgi:hypothetical protein
MQTGRANHRVLARDFAKEVKVLEGVEAGAMRLRLSVSPVGHGGPSRVAHESALFGPIRPDVAAGAPKSRHHLTAKNQSGAKGIGRLMCAEEIKAMGCPSGPPGFAFSLPLTGS